MPACFARTNFLQTIQLVEVVGEQHHVPLHIHSKGQLTCKSLQHLPLCCLFLIRTSIDHLHMNVLECICRFGRQFTILLDDCATLITCTGFSPNADFEVAHHPQTLQQFTFDLVGWDHQTLTSVLQLRQVFLRL